MLQGGTQAPPDTTKRTGGIPLEPVLVGWLGASAVVVLQLIKTTTSVRIGMGPGAGRVDNGRLWPCHALSWSALDHPWRPKPNCQLTTPPCIAVELQSTAGVGLGLATGDQYHHNRDFVQYLQRELAWGT